MRMHIDAQIDQDIRSVLEWEVHSFRYVHTHTYRKFARVHVCAVKCCKVMPMIRRTRDINQFRDKNWFSFASLLASIMKFHVSAAARNMAGSRQACIALTGICRVEWHLISKAVQVMLSVLSDISAKSAASVTEEVEDVLPQAPNTPGTKALQHRPLLQKRTACRALHYKVHSIVCTKRSLDIGLL